MNTPNNRPRRGGPVTEEGKRRSSLNALKHGLDARSPQAFEQLARETGIEYNAIAEEMYAHFRPADPLEAQLVKRIARCVWRLARAEAMEKRIFETGSNRRKPSTSYERILKYERLVDIHLHRAIAALDRKRGNATKIK